MDPTAALTRKKKIRAGHRAALTRSLGDVASALDSADPDRNRIARLKLTLNEKLETLNRLDGEIIELVDEDTLENEIQQSDEYKERIYEAMTRVNQILDVSTTPTPAPTPAVAATVTPGDYSAKVNLPKITLPHFSGNVMKWTAFWDSYESAIHNNRELSDVDKFNYLRSLLERSAYDAISGLTLSTANYDEAIAILKKRFGCKQMIISKHMETLLNTESVSSDSHLRDLRRLYDTTESHIRSLNSLGVEATSYGAMLLSVILTKLPPDLRLIVSRKMSSDDDMTMENLLKVFEAELVARERASNHSSSTSHNQVRRNTDRGRHSALLSGAHESGTNASFVCCYCQQQHAAKDCTTVMDVNTRKQILRSSGRCYNCLRKGHIGRLCRSASKCQRCKGRHHTSICEAGGAQADEVTSLARPEESSNSTNSTSLNPSAPSYSPATTTALCSDQQKSVLLQTARGILQNPQNTRKLIEVRLLLDSGSQKSYLTERARRLLGLESSQEQQLSIATFGSQQEQIKVCPVVEVRMRLKGQAPMTLSLCVVPTICEPLVSQPITACIQQNKAFSGLDLADHSDGEVSLQVDLLIGSDYYWDLVTGSTCKIEGGPTAVHTKLGWVLSGPTSARSATSCSVNLTTTHVLRVDAQVQETRGLDEQLKSFWDLESLGIHEEEKTLYDDFANCVTFRDGRYQVSLPWKEFHEPLSDNYLLSVKRLRGLLCRLRQDPEILKEYDRTIKDQLQKGIIELIPDEEPRPTQTHYLPHHAIVRRDRATTKVRVVYDASAKSDGPSLNECLHKGPKFQQLILDLLLRFRSYRVALTADIEKAFLMIAIDNKDRDVLRFVWVDDVDKEDPKMQTYRFARVVFGVSSSPFLLNATIKFHLESFMESHQSTVERLLRSTYVDDIVCGADTEEEAFEFYAQAKELFRRGGFNLRKFQTNSEKLQQKIDEAEGVSDHTFAMDLFVETYSQAVLGTQSPTKSDECKVLGVLWSPGSDCLMFDVSELAQEANTLQPTKRNIVSLIGKFYDPLGFLTPVTIKFKILLQKLCRDKLEWDEPLPADLLSEWKKLAADLNEGGPLSIPRSYFLSGNEKPSSVTLCGFCDASMQAYAAVVYIVLSNNHGVTVRFVASKTRVAPLQSQTIPRLELLSALLLSKLIASVANSLKSTLPPTEVRCYTDSQVALFWIQGISKEWKPFVANRVSEIRRNVNPSLWSHCPGISNPADLPSRGLSPVELSVNQLWRQGPEWLHVGVEPSVQTSPQSMPEGCATELKTKTARALTLVTTVSGSHVSELIDCQRFGNLTKLLRVTAQVIRAKERFKALKNRQNDTLTVAQITEAELLWVKDAQQSMKQKKEFEQHRTQFNLFEDEKGVWRCRGRLSNLDESYAVKNPILLPRNHPLTSLLVQAAHERVFHDGIKETLTEIRRKYWIPRLRSLTRQLLFQCVVCRKLEGTSFKPPPPPPLPVFRLKEDPAFTYTGVDFAGPIYVRGSDGISQKAWICLFTCYVTRAVHLEATPDQSTETFLRCLKKFSARRGLPTKFISDNGKTFKAASKYLKAVFKDGKVKEYLSSLGVEWMFNVERAPWWGGAFERLVRSTKRCLRKFVEKAQISFDELVTVLAEIESVINSRPLTYMSASDMEEPLTPSHLIVGRRIHNLPDHLGHLEDLDGEEFTLDASQLTRRMKYLASVLNNFWYRWRSEYLTELRETHAYTARKQSRSQHSSVSVGELVVVHDEHLPRGLWKLGKIISVMKGRDGFVRGATVETTNKDGQKAVLNRPIQLLFPLEVQSREPVSDGSDVAKTSGEPGCESRAQPPDDETVDESPEPINSEGAPRRSQRVAAQRANARRMACMLELEDD